MDKRQNILIVTLILLITVDAGLYLIDIFDTKPLKKTSIHDEFMLSTNEPIHPISPFINANPKKTALGFRLFKDKRLSGDGNIACVSCHHLQTTGADGLVVSKGVGGASGNVNTPTVFNIGLSQYFFWDGRANSLDNQISQELTDPKHMAADWKSVFSQLKSDHDYPALFAEIYQNGLTYSNFVDALAEFERSLTTPNARFDNYLRGNQSAITNDELMGYQLFKKYGCSSCHQGTGVGGNMFERLGSVNDYFADHGQGSQADLGRYNVTHREEHRHYFKVSSLRNVELTAPYFHNGSAKTLEEAIRVMAYYNIGIVMPDNDIRLIASFLKTLTGEKPESLQ